MDPKERSECGLEKTLPLADVVKFIVDVEPSLPISEYKKFGDSLEIKRSILDQIIMLRNNSTDSPYETMYKILQECLKQSEGKRNASDLVEIVSSMGFAGVAESLHDHLKLKDTPNLKIVLEKASSETLCKRTQFFGFRDPISNFTGREQMLQDIDQALEKDEAGVVIHATLSGLGGIGKTELSRKYAVEHCSKFGAVVWINAESSATILQSLQNLASDSRVGIALELKPGKDKEPETLSQEIFRHFCESGLYEKRPLFIFDNADNLGSHEGDPGHEDRLKPFLPHRRMHPLNPAIIVTSQNREWKNCSFTLLQIDTFTAQESIGFLKSSLGSVTNDDESLSKLAEELGNLPLALKQAVAYILAQIGEQRRLQNGDEFGVPEYLTLLRVKAGELLGYRLPEDSLSPYEKTCLTTWNITMDRIRNIALGELAIVILQKMSLLSNADMTLQLLFETMKNYGRWGRFANYWNLTWLLEKVVRRPKVVLAQDFELAIKVLEKYCLIQTERKRVYIHKLVQKSVFLQMPDSDLQERTKAILHGLSIYKVTTRGSRISLQNLTSVYDALVQKQGTIEDGILKYFNIIVEGFIEGKILYKLGHDNIKEPILLINLAQVDRLFDDATNYWSLLQKAYQFAKSKFCNDHKYCATVLLMIIHTSAFNYMLYGHLGQSAMTEFLSLLKLHISCLSESSSKKLNVEKVFEDVVGNFDRIWNSPGKYIELLKNYMEILKEINGAGEERLRFVTKEIEGAVEYVENLKQLQNNFNIANISGESTGREFLVWLDKDGLQILDGSLDMKPAWQHVSKCIEYLVGSKKSRP